MSSQFAANFAAICRDEFTPSWIPGVCILFHPLPLPPPPLPISEGYETKGAAPGEMSREIVPEEFINFL